MDTKTVVNSSVLSIVKSAWNGTIMITGDSNIDLLASTKFQKDTLKYLKLMI